jgi:hypothetical protein
MPLGFFLARRGFRRRRGFLKGSSWKGVRPPEREPYEGVRQMDQIRKGKRKASRARRADEADVKTIRV